MGSAQSSHAKNQIAPAKEQLQKLEVSVNQCVRGRKSAHEVIKQSVVVIDDIEPTLEVEDEELDDSVVYESDEGKMSLLRLSFTLKICMRSTGTLL